MRQIDLQKVLLVTNSTAPQSGIDAADYISRRGLNPNHILSFSFPSASVNYKIDPGYFIISGAPTTILCTTSGYIGQKFCTAIANYALAHKIEAVIVSTYTPSSSTDNWPLAIYASNAIYYTYMYQAGEGLNPQFLSQPAPNISADTPEWINTRKTVNWYPYDNPQVNPFCLIPAGRIGSAAAERTGAGTLEYAGVYNSAVTNALIAEQQDHTNSVHVGSTVVNYDPYWPASINAAIYTWMKDNSGLTNVVSAGYSKYTLTSTAINATQTEIPVNNPLLFTSFPNYAQLWGNDPVYGDPVYETISYTGIAYSPPRLTGVTRGIPGSDYHPANTFYRYFSTATTPSGPPYNKAMNIFARLTPIQPAVLNPANGTYYLQPYAYPLVDPTMPPFFSLCLGMALNLPSSEYMSDALAGKVVPGAFGGIATSFSYRFGEALLLNGGSAATATGGEPGASFVVLPSAIFMFAQIYRLPLILANFISNFYYAGGGTTIIGDPLYAPYKSTPLGSTSVETSGIAASTTEGTSFVWGDVVSTNNPNWTNIPTI